MSTQPTAPDNAWENIILLGGREVEKKVKSQPTHSKKDFFQVTPFISDERKGHFQVTDQQRTEWDLILKFSANKNLFEAGKTALLLPKHEDLSSDPQYPCKSYVWWRASVSPAARGVRHWITGTCWPPV